MLLGQFAFPAVARDYCVKRNILTELGGYNEGRSLYEDLELLIKIAEKYFFYCTYETGTVYRQAAGGLSSQKVRDHDEARNAIFQERTSQFAFWKKIVYTIRWRWYQAGLAMRRRIRAIIDQVMGSVHRR